MNRNDKWFWAGMLLAMFVAPLAKLSYELSVPSAEGTLPADELPDFTRFDDVDAKKTAFFDFLTPFIQYQNRKILEQRRELQQLMADAEQRGGYTRSMRKQLKRLAEQYQLETKALEAPEIAERLLKRVDIVPVSLALSQSANESAWGTSRFAVEGNNLFGQWCYSPGCGLVPEEREQGRRHQVASFAKPSRSVASYIRNLNTHPAYKGFRELRAELREKDVPLDGLRLAQGLLRYSERGEEYVREIRSMIRYNDLQEYENL